MRDAAKEGGALGKVLEDIRGRATGATPAVGGLINNLSGLGPMAAIAGGVALAVGAIGTAAIKAAAQTQAWNAQIETITKNSEKAKETYAALVNFGNSTPFDTGQSVQAFVKLRQMGLAATEERLRSFGNTASASGKSLNQMIEAVADAGTGEFERLKEFGIKTKTEGQKVTFTMAGVKTTVENNSVAITKYLENIGNTKFAGAMAKQMDTLNGAFSNVEDSTRSMFSAIGEGKLGSAVKDIAKSIADGISLITPFMGSIGNAVGGIIQGVGSILNGLGSLWAGFGGAEGATNLMDGLTVALNLVGEGAQVLGSAVGSVFGFIGGLASSVGEMWRSSFGSLFGDLGNLFDVGTRSWSNSIVGILRAVKFVVGQMPNMFKVAVSDIMKMFRDMGNGILAFLTGDWKKGVELFNKPQFVSSQKAVGATWKGAQATYRDEKGRTPRSSVCWVALARPSWTRALTRPLIRQRTKTRRRARAKPKSWPRRLRTSGRRSKATAKMRRQPTTLSAPLPTRVRTSPLLVLTPRSSWSSSASPVATSPLRKRSASMPHSRHSAQTSFCLTRLSRPNSASMT